MQALPMHARYFYSQSRDVSAASAPGMLLCLAVLLVGLSPQQAGADLSPPLRIMPLGDSITQWNCGL